MKTAITVLALCIAVTVYAKKPPAPTPAPTPAPQSNTLTAGEKLEVEALSHKRAEIMQALQTLQAAAYAGFNVESEALEQRIRHDHNMVDGDEIKYDTATISRKTDREAAEKKARAEAETKARTEQAAKPPQPPSLAEERVKQAMEKAKSVPGPQTTPSRSR